MKYLSEGTACFHALRRAMSDALYAGQELRYVVEEVVGDMDKSLSMVCKQLGTRLMKDEMKSDFKYLLGSGGSRFLGDLNGFTSMWEEHIRSPAENTKQKIERLGVHITKNVKQHLTESTACFRVMGWIMNDTLHAGQKVKLLGKNYPGINEENSRKVRAGKLGIYKTRYRVEVNMMHDPRQTYAEIEHILSPVENAKQKADGTSETESYKDLFEHAQAGRLMIHTIKQHLPAPTCRERL